MENSNDTISFGNPQAMNGQIYNDPNQDLGAFG